MHRQDFPHEEGLQREEEMYMSNPLRDTQMVKSDLYHVLDVGTVRSAMGDS